MKVTINSAHFAATWHWSVPPDEVCGICRVPFDGCCPECSIPGDDCPLIWGKCTHVYHLHCILRWINSENSKGQCPLDRQPWVTAT
ncbi:anaphase-promoting complex subunit Apc11 [Saitoella complicata NRRL Y-17804]|uniref:Anaphase-promoting complex subunit 11 n=1 Tax=Saitoella complicata (strain BCRC 22490 / CBS 7301 / JCM 7358 / NBRC 10748 / NRRL Y-17804) TaxID=698492 RepID=A0A0E9NIR6_SAICN|nr:anaphase-promoting complex subunit Apc11 [Saitoella complicata NRRL Y-17804]ODQ51239.1 anaphase-promoting complex subunit Apc11 [Saitoella complicata NRRL Y-17804]GAO49305.1 hypothetical protein G7K_3456-t1 [Saitoella complicata NRRL Y-17804]